MADPLLPAEFAELEPHAATWCLSTEAERWSQRLRRSMEEMQAFYDAMGFEILSELRMLIRRIPGSASGARD